MQNHTMPPPIDKFSMAVIEEVIREVEHEINKENVDRIESDHYVNDSYEHGLLGGGLDEPAEGLGMGGNDT